MLLSGRGMSVRGRKKALWVGTFIAWVGVAVVATLALLHPDGLHFRTLLIIALSIALGLFTTAVMATLITGPDVAYRLGVEHGKQSACTCRQQTWGTGTNGQVVPFRRNWADN